MLHFVYFDYGKEGLRQRKEGEWIETELSRALSSTYGPHLTHNLVHRDLPRVFLRRTDLTYFLLGL
jgi:hypothetical protein